MGDGARTITVAAGQIRARLMNETDETLASLDEAITRAAEKRVDLLVLPECAYPAYLIGSATSYRAGKHLTSEQFLTWLSERAARYRLHVVSGLVEDVGDALYNTAVLIDDRGRELGRARKRFLWHVDHDWFAPGEEIRAFDSAVGRIGIVICAETRAPEIVATLAADGAELLAMPTCWINTARDPGRYENPQVEFMIEARAREFGVPFVCADKWGLELGAVGYVGQSRIVRADGSAAAEAPATGDAVIEARVRLRRGRGVWMSPARRRRLLEEGYAGADGPVETSAAVGSRRVVVAAMPTVVANERYQGGMGESLFEPLRARGVGLLMVNMSLESPAEQMAMLARAYDMHAVGFPQRADAYALGPAKVGCVAGQWMRSFATPRALALEGAEVLMCFDGPQDAAILRTRALENRVFVVGADERTAIIIAPDGRVAARTGGEHPAEAVAEIDLAEAQNKLIAPQTHVFEERRGRLYRF